MDFLSKHFFDYQSFVNIPQKAVQLHKTPYSDAGIDPSAAWIPKNMRVQGRNLAAPASRPNRNRIEALLGSHRHGKPSKLEFRKFGERHGELKDEKIVPHKDKWMVALDGDFKHFGGDTEEEKYHHVCIPSDFFPTFFKNKRELDIQLLVILTRSPRYISLTIKAIRGLKSFKNHFIKIQLYDGRHLIDERKLFLPKSRFASYQLLPIIRQNNIQQEQPIQNGPSRRFPPTAPASPQVNYTNRVRGRASSDRHLADSLIRTPFDEGESFVLYITPKQAQDAFIVIQVHANERAQNEHRHLPTPVDEIGHLEHLEIIEGLENVDQKTEMIGCCVIGNVRTPCRGYFHWQQMLRQSGPVCMWHSLMGNKKHSA